jgi:RimJ/RimL family protein N-acetyltransferase
MITHRVAARTSVFGLSPARAAGYRRRVMTPPATARLVLRPLTSDDVDNLLTLDADAEVMRYLSPDLASRAEVASDTLPTLLAHNRDWPGLGWWAAQRRGVFVGWFALTPVTPSQEAMVRWPYASTARDVLSLGYRLRRSAWGHGYATEGARALVRYAFGLPATRELTATTMAVNGGSRRVLEKAGLRLARTVHVAWDDPLPGTEHGEVEYRLTRAEHQDAVTDENR